MVDVKNSLFVVLPYWYDGTWVFDDERVGLVREPFVAGIPEMLDYLVRDIPDARDGFRLMFSTAPFPDYDESLTWRREEYGGNWYQMDGGPRLEGWLCPALTLYTPLAPERLYVSAEAIAPECPECERPLPVAARRCYDCDPEV